MSFDMCVFFFLVVEIVSVKVFVFLFGGYFYVLIENLLLNLGGLGEGVLLDVDWVNSFNKYDIFFLNICLYF